MKKMITLMALAALATGAMAAEDVDSGNIVGYAKLKQTHPQMIFGASFKTIGTETLDIQSIGCTAEDDGTFSISWWSGSDPRGAGFYNRAYWEDGEWLTLAGIPVTKVFEVGEGFMYAGDPEDILTFPNPLTE